MEIFSFACYGFPKLLSYFNGIETWEKENRLFVVFHSSAYM